MKVFELLPRPLGNIFRKLTHLPCNSPLEVRRYLYKIMLTSHFRRHYIFRHSIKYCLDVKGVYNSVLGSTAPNEKVQR